MQVAWLAAVQNLTTEDVLLQWRVTPEQIAAEDASLSVTIPLTVPVRVELPARRRTTQGIERDGNGEIVRVESLETDDEK